MTKQELCIYLTTHTGMTMTAAEAAVNGVCEAIRTALVHGEDVTLRDFGNFQRTLRPRRTARNPKTGEPVVIDEQYGVKFKPGKGFKDAVNQR